MLLFMGAKSELANYICIGLVNYVAEQLRLFTFPVKFFLSNRIYDVQSFYSKDLYYI